MRYTSTQFFGRLPLRTPAGSRVSQHHRLRQRSLDAVILCYHSPVFDVQLKDPRPAEKTAAAPIRPPPSRGKDVTAWLVGKTLGSLSPSQALGTGGHGRGLPRQAHRERQMGRIKIVAPKNLADKRKRQASASTRLEIPAEAQTPNIVRLIANGRFGGTPFYDIEYVEGECGQGHGCAAARIGWEEVVRLGQPALRRSQARPRPRIVHRRYQAIPT